jgi:hypothetical protein
LGEDEAEHRLTGGREARAMSLELLFLIANAVALVGWAFLLFGRPGPGRHIAIARGVALGLAAFYFLLFLTNAPGLGILGRDYSLNGIGAFFAVPELRLLGWVHYLAFDLWVGSWESEEAGRSGVPRAPLIVCLILTYALGPLGLIAFMLVRRAFGGRSPPR